MKESSTIWNCNGIPNNTLLWVYDHLKSTITLALSNGYCIALLYISRLGGLSVSKVSLKLAQETVIAKHWEISLCPEGLRESVRDKYSAMQILVKIIHWHIFCGVAFSFFCFWQIVFMMSYYIFWRLWLVLSMQYSEANKTMVAMIDPNVLKSSSKSFSWRALSSATVVLTSSQYTEIESTVKEASSELRKRYLSVYKYLQAIWTYQIWYLQVSKVCSTLLIEIGRPFFYNVKWFLFQK